MSEWKTIESSPRNEWLLVLAEGRHRVWQLHEFYGMYYTKTYTGPRLHFIKWVDQDMRQQMKIPTHWMPLPPPPKEERDEK